MYDVTIIGGGAAANSCYDVLSRNGLRVTRAFELDPDDVSPLILGESHGAYQAARQAAEAGRHILIASPHALSPERLSLLLENRHPTQALFVWSERRYHPGYRLLSGLTEADALSSAHLSKISLTLLSLPGVRMISPATFSSHSKRSALIPSGRMAIDAQPSSAES